MDANVTQLFQPLSDAVLLNGQLFENNWYRQNATTNSF